MNRTSLRVPVLVAALALALTAARPAHAQVELLARPALLKVNWFGPFAITPNDTARFVYTNLGADAVRIEWAFTNAETGDLVCGNFGNPVEVKAGRGAIWEYQQTLSFDANGQPTETRICDGKPTVSDELYFDSKLRHELVAWIFIQHSSQRGFTNAVDLPTVQLYNSLLVPAVQVGGDATTPPDGTRSMTFGRTFEVIHANPTAPTEFPKALLPRQ